MKANIKNMKGSGFFKKSKLSFSNVVKNTKKSESSLINAFEEMDKKAKHYNKSYINHMENIKMLDDYVNFNGMETLFKKVIMRDNFVKGHIDKSNPLLFRNYIIEGEVLPSTFRNEHLMNQVRYVINKSFAGRDYAFIKYQTISDISKHDFLLNIVTIENIKQKKVIPHDDFLIDKEKVKKFLTDILSTTKKNLKRTSLIAEFSDDDKSDDNSNSLKSKTNKYKSKKSTSKKSKSKMSLLNLGKNKSKSKKTKSISKFHINNNNNKKKTIKPIEKLDEHMTDWERKIRNDKIKAEKQASQPTGAPGQTYQKTENKKNLILGSTPNYGSPIQDGVVKQVFNDPIRAKCEAHGTDAASCNMDSQDCFVHKSGNCYKKPLNKTGFGNPNPAFGNPNPAFGNPNPAFGNPNPAFGNPNPAFGNSNPFGVQQKPAESLV
jgi:hypothetical protein